jgi:hypothetical protein
MVSPVAGGGHSLIKDFARLLYRGKSFLLREKGRKKLQSYPSVTQFPVQVKIKNMAD